MTARTSIGGRLGRDGAPGLDWRRIAPGDAVRNGAIVVALMALTLLLPPAIYGALVWRQFDFIEVSGYMPYEELGQALAAGDPGGILAAPLWTANMTSGFLLSNMYTLTVAQLLLTAGLGLFIALNVIEHLSLRRVCPVIKAHGTATAAGSGLLATVGASSTGIMGCCGSGFAGGALALAGLSATTADAVAGWSLPVQGLFIAGFALNWFRLRRRRAALSP